MNRITNSFFIGFLLIGVINVCFAQTSVMYDFESLTPNISIHGQDNWFVHNSYSTVNNGNVCPPAAGTELPPGIFTSTGSGTYTSSQALNTPGGVTFGYGNQHAYCSRVNDANWSIPTFAGAEAVVMEVDWDGNYWGKQLRVGYDSDNDGNFSTNCNTADANEISFGIGTSQSNIRVYDATGANVATGARPSEWCRVRLCVDLLANSGQGAATVFYKDHASSGSWTAHATLSNINMGFNTAAADQTNPANINGMVFDQEAGGASFIDNISFDVYYSGFSGCTYTQSPGNESNDLNLWLKANDNGGVVIDNTTITTWVDQSGNGNDGTNASAPKYRDAAAFQFNYNPSVYLDGSSFFTLPDATISPSDENYSIFVVFRNDLTANNQTLVHAGENNTNEWITTRIHTDGGIDDRFNNVGVNNSPAGVVTANEQTLAHFTYNTTLNNKKTFVDGAFVAQLNGVANKNTKATFNSVGGHWDDDNSLFKNFYLGEIAEVIVYNESKEGSTIKEQIESYLAVKYGITLTNDYYSSNGNIIYTVSTYGENIIGIGRDDDEALEQKQSHTLNDTTRIYLNTLQSSNAANTGSFSSDISYLLVGDNQGKMCETTVSNAEVPTIPNLTSTGRLEREWKVTKTNITEDVSFDFTLNACASSNLTTNCLYFLVDDDGDFSNGGTNYYTNNDGTGVVITNTAGVVSVSNISVAHLPNNSTQYVTLASYIPALIASNDTTICSGQSIVVSASGAVTYTWDNSLGAGQTHPVTPGVNTTYHVTGTNINGCTNMDSVVVTVNEATAGTDVQTTCGNYTWIDGNTYTSSNTTATHTIVGGAANGCDSVVTLNLTISNAVNSTDVQTTCGNYTWIDGNTYTSSNTTATHTIVGGAANGCDSVVTLNLTISNAVNSTDVQTTCGNYTWIDGNTYTSSNTTATHTIVGGAANGCDSVVTLNLTISNAVNSTDVQTACGNYTWIDGNTYTSSNTTATHTIVGGAANGCDSIVTLNLTIFPNLVISLGNDTLFCNEAILLTPGAGYTSYSWNDGSSNPTLLVEASGTYSVVVTDVEGCSGVDDIEVIEDCPFTLWVPNVFTPNGDNHNKVFKVVSENIALLEVMIFNRWGQLIYSWENIEGFWDGEINSGEMAPDGTYPYIVRYSYYNKGLLVQDKKVGNITLLR
ncbi:MAG: gliding motility-associated C-terminal domain-containing protein [Flavobacteriales bacterium]|nr:gliding motility-associated C-terminal domain-containing protein [Flavobacteriales bacterium]